MGSAVGAATQASVPDPGVAAVPEQDVMGMSAKPVKVIVLPRISLMIGVNTWNVHCSVTLTGWPITIDPPKAGSGMGDWSQSMLAHSAVIRALYSACRAASGVPPHASGYDAA
jgi:hypothetical protein